MLHCCCLRIIGNLTVFVDLKSRLGLWWIFPCILSVSGVIITKYDVTLVLLTPWNSFFFVQSIFILLTRIVVLIVGLLELIHNLWRLISQLLWVQVWLYFFWIQRRIIKFLMIFVPFLVLVQLYFDIFASLKLIYLHIRLVLNILVLLILNISEARWNDIIHRGRNVLIKLINFWILNCWHLYIFIHVILLRNTFLKLKLLQEIVLHCERWYFNKIILKFCFLTLMQKEFVAFQNTFICSFWSHKFDHTFETIFELNIIFFDS